MASLLGQASASVRPLVLKLETLDRLRFCYEFLFLKRGIVWRLCMPSLHRPNFHLPLCQGLLRPPRRSRDPRPRPSGLGLRFSVDCFCAPRSFSPFVLVEAIRDPIHLVLVPEVVLVVQRLLLFFGIVGGLILVICAYIG